MFICGYQFTDFPRRLVIAINSESYPVTYPAAASTLTLKAYNALRMTHMVDLQLRGHKNGDLKKLGLT